MRVLQVVPRIAARSSGPSYSVVRLSEVLAQAGCDIELNVLEPLPENQPAVPLHAWPTPPLPGAYRLGWSPQMKRGLRMAAQGADIVHNHSLWMMPNIYCQEAAKRAGCKLMFSPRGTLSEWAMQRSSGRKKLVWWAGQQAALFGADCLHATSKKELEEIRSLGLRQPVALIFNGVDLPVLQASHIGTGQRTVLFLSRIHPVKNVEMLLRVWQELEAQAPDWRLQIAGPLEGDYPRAMQRLAQALGLQQIEFLGEVTGPHKHELLAAADLFVLPTHSENFGMAVAEALACGTPAIVTQAAPWGGLEEYGCGWWIESGAEALHSALLKAMAEPASTLVERGTRGRAWMQAEFAWPVLGQRMMAVYRWLLGQGDKPAWVHD